jgi:hypothetical protein
VADGKFDWRQTLGEDEGVVDVHERPPDGQQYSARRGDSENLVATRSTIRLRDARKNCLSTSFNSSERLTYSCLVLSLSDNFEIASPSIKVTTPDILALPD